MSEDMFGYITKCDTRPQVRGTQGSVGGARGRAEGVFTWGGLWRSPEAYVELGDILVYGILPTNIRILAQNKLPIQ
jgi:hypothetical protein